MTDARLYPRHLRLDREQAAHLAGLIDAAEETPCQSAPSWWTSEDLKVQLLAVRACRDCPVLALCRDYGLTYPDERGVYGGLTEDARRPRRKQQRKEAS